MSGMVLLPCQAVNHGFFRRNIECCETVKAADPVNG